jgi:carboxymethylenebutenolidase
MNDRANLTPDPANLPPDLDSLVPAVPFSRRGFIASSVATGFAVSAGPLMAQTMIKTSMDGLEGGDIKIPTIGGDMPGYYAVPKKPGKYPVILVVGEIWGAHEHIKDVTRRIAKAGYFAVTNEQYWKQGELWKLSDIKEVLAKANSLTDDQAFNDLDSTVRWAEKQPKANANRLGITGFCRGGRMVWMYSAWNKKVDAGVAWYGGLSPAGAITATPMDITDKLNAPVLGLYGGKDQGIPLDQVERLRAGLLAFGKDKESIIHVYPEAGHAFNADYRPSYRKAEADDAWKRMLAWFKKHGV